ncbi:hypothetical protein DWZ66_08085 [Coprobacillus sp. AF34-1BH]|nr:hypothetical protein DWZ66_08085 [Coprobacillus sp. AF34-1BH]
MKVKNKDLRAINSALLSLGNHQGDISKRWSIAKLARKFNNANELLSNQINKLVEEQGKEDKNGQKTLSPLNEDFLKLMDLDIDIECSYFTIKQLEEYSPTVKELVSLEPIIEEGDD